MAAGTAVDADRRPSSRRAVCPHAAHAASDGSAGAEDQYRAHAQRQRPLVSQSRRQLRPDGERYDRVAGRSGMVRGPSRLHLVPECLRHNGHPSAQHRLRGRCRTGLHA